MACGSSSIGTSVTEERSERDVIGARRAALERLRAAGVEPFAMSLQTALGVAEADTAAALRAGHGDLGPDARSETTATVAGRIVLARRFGALTFLTVRDRTGPLSPLVRPPDR